MREGLGSRPRDEALFLRAIVPCLLGLIVSGELQNQENHDHNREDA
jgi:hypothetical protein